MRFDWYQTTIDAPADDVLEQVMKLGDRVKDADKLASRYRYDKGWEISRDDCGTVAHVFAGGNGESLMLSLLAKQRMPLSIWSAVNGLIGIW